MAAAIIPLIRWGENKLDDYDEFILPLHYKINKFHLTISISMNDSMTNLNNIGFLLGLRMDSI